MLASDIAEKLKSRLIGSDVKLEGLRSLTRAKSSDLALILCPKDILLAKKTSAGCILASIDNAACHAASFPTSIIVVEDVFLSFVNVIKFFIPKETSINKPKLGINSIIHNTAFIDNNVIIGDNCVIGPGAKILKNTMLGNNVIIGANCVIGGAAFIFAQKADRSNVKVLAIKGVFIEDDVELGSSVCIDQGVLEPTIIKKGVKIDNIVQIGHDVFIDCDTVICGQSGVAGYAKIGKRCLLGGQSGVSSYVKIGDDVRVNGKSGVFKNIRSKMVVGGIPAIVHEEFISFSVVRSKLKILVKDWRKKQFS